MSPRPLSPSTLLILAFAIGGYAGRCASFFITNALQIPRRVLPQSKSTPDIFRSIPAPSFDYGAAAKAFGESGHLLAEASAGDLATETAEATRVYIDVSAADRPMGRLVFHIPSPNPLPLHSDNVIKIFAEARKSIDPRCTYVGCEFSYSPQFVEGMAQYRWAHVLPGNGRNAVGKADGRIEDRESLGRCFQRVFGGSYYGLNYSSLPSGGEYGAGAVVLTVPLSGSGRGSSCFSIVRVGESPREWGERLLLNGAVLGWMDPICQDVLKDMATQREGPPTVTSSGLLEYSREI